MINEEIMVFFADENLLGHNITEILRSAEVRVELVPAHFLMQTL